MASIKIDATPLDFDYFIIPGVTGWTDGTQVQTIELAPGTYNYQIGSGGWLYADFTFSVGADGLVGYAPEFGSFLAGAGTDTLRLNGFEVTLDARYMPGLGLIWSGDIPSTGWFQLRTCRVLPAKGYRVQQGSGVVCDFVFAVDLNGRFQYPPALDAGVGGPLKGNGTSRIEFLGFPLLVDARNAGAGLMVQPIAWGVPFAYSGVVTLNLLPAAGFRLQFDSGVVTDDGFDLKPDGTFVLHDVGVPNLALDKFHGLDRLTVRNRLRRPLPVPPRPVTPGR